MCFSLNQQKTKIHLNKIRHETHENFVHIYTNCKLFSIVASTN